MRSRLTKDRTQPVGFVVQPAHARSRAFARREMGVDRISRAQPSRASGNVQASLAKQMGQSDRPREGGLSAAIRAAEHPHAGLVSGKDHRIRDHPRARLVGS